MITPDMCYEDAYKLTKVDSDHRYRNHRFNLPPTDESFTPMLETIYEEFRKAKKVYDPISAVFNVGSLYWHYASLAASEIDAQDVSNLKPYSVLTKVLDHLHNSLT